MKYLFFLAAHKRYDIIEAVIETADIEINYIEDEEQ